MLKPSLSRCLSHSANCLSRPLQVQAERARAWNRAQDVVQLDPPLFPPVALDPTGPPATGPHLSTESLRRAVHRVCKAVGVPIVTTHALRGTHASISVSQGQAVEEVARRLGHGPGVTRTAYATADSQAAGRARR